MPRTAELIAEHGRQIVRLPDDIHFPGGEVLVRQDEVTGDVILSPITPAKKGGDFDKLFQLLTELGPAPDEFMLNVCDPLLEAEDIFGPEEELP
jgi:virulence-associated protein VagC